MKSHLLITCLLLTISAIGQKHSISINYKPSVTCFGKQSQSFSNYYFISRKGDWTYNNVINVLYNYKINSRITFSTGLEYSQQGQNINFNTDSDFPNFNKQILKIELNYLRIPFIADYSIIKIEKLELNVYSGISLGLAIKRKDNYQNIILEDILLPPAEKRYKNADWAIPIGVACKKEITSKLFTTFGCEYSLGLTNAFSENSVSKYGVLSEFDNSKQNRFSLNIGIGFSLTK